MNQTNNNSMAVEPEIENTVVPAQVVKNIESIAKLQSQEEQTKTLHFKLLDRVASFSARPAFLYLLLIFFILWWLASKLHRSGVLAWNIPDYRLQEQLLDTISFLISTAILIRQNRQEQFADRQSHLMLQLDILSEQKITKIIELLEELRTDLPNVIDRVDPEVESMKQPTDPEIVINVIQDSLITVESPPSDLNILAKNKSVDMPFDR